MSRTQFTVTIKPELGDYIKRVAEEESTTKSAIVERAIAEYEERRTEELMREGYIEMAGIVDSGY